MMGEWDDLEEIDLSPHSVNRRSTKLIKGGRAYLALALSYSRARQKKPIQRLARSAEQRHIPITLAPVRKDD